MKRIKMLLYPAAFVFALSVSFAFKPVAAPPMIAYTKNPAPFCTSTIVCDGGPNLCIVDGQVGYADIRVCTVPEFEP